MAKKVKKQSNNEEKELLEKEAVQKAGQPKSDNEELSEAEMLLKIKEEMYSEKTEEEEEVEEVPDTALTKTKKKIGFFLDYYKWFIIIPAIVIVIAVVMITSYLSESKDRALELSIMNAAFEIPDIFYAVENDYVEYTGNEIDAKDIRIEYNFRYPNTDAGVVDFSQDEAVSSQKFNAMVIAGRVDVAITNTWVINAFSATDSTLDLREIYDEDFLKRYEEKIYYVKDSNGDKIPVAFYIDAPVIVNAYEDDALPLAVSFDTSKHREETARFMKWLLEDAKNVGVEE